MSDMVWEADEGVVAKLVLTAIQTHSQERWGRSEELGLAVDRIGTRGFDEDHPGCSSVSPLELSGIGLQWDWSQAQPQQRCLVWEPLVRFAVGNTLPMALSRRRSFLED